MSRLNDLLNQTAPLERHEVGDLREWLAVLEADCDAFGETPEDTARIARIKAKIAAHESEDRA